MKVQMTSHKGPASGPNETLISLDGVRIVLLRQIINEILQYTESPHYGIGLFLSGLESEKIDRALRPVKKVLKPLASWPFM